MSQSNDNEANKLIEESWNSKIIIVGPSTLPFLLKAVENMWRVDKQSKDNQRFDSRLQHCQRFRKRCCLLPQEARRSNSP